MNHAELGFAPPAVGAQGLPGLPGLRPTEQSPFDHGSTGRSRCPMVTVCICRGSAVCWPNQ